MKNNKRIKIYKYIKTLAKEEEGLLVKEIIDDERLKNFKVSTGLLSYDFSKQRISQKSLYKLLPLLDEIELKESIKNISKGGSLNSTEDRKVSHMLYRKPETEDTSEIEKKIFKQEILLEKFVKNILEDKGVKFKTIISIGIGGSRLGPEILSEVFKDTSSLIKVHYCSSLDLIELEGILSRSDPAETLIVIASKSFKTIEVLKNAKRAKEWLESFNSINVRDHLVAVSSSKEGMDEFGIKNENQFTLLDSLGGRYSIWSSVSLPSIVDMGWSKFKEFKKGAFLADQHFLESSWDKNIPVLMAILSMWNTNGLGINNLSIFTYDFRIRSLYKYLAQLMMESNGKTFNEEGFKTPFYTCPIIWGGYGPESQHSVFQWLLQGSDYSACDFIGVGNSQIDLTDSYEMLLSQVTALSQGEEDSISMYKSVSGNNPISLFKMNRLSPQSLGFLVSCYEHKVFVESQIYGINPFDQWGVQLGKKLSKKSQKNKIFMNKFFDREFLV